MDANATLKIAVVGYDEAPHWLEGTFDLTQAVELLEPCTGYNAAYLTQRLRKGARLITPADTGGTPKFRVEVIDSAG